MASKRTGKVSPLTVSKLWAKSGGRCEYDGCNKLLYKDDLTSDEINRAYVAHIVAASPDGPRGDVVLSAKLVDDLSNVMLMCGDHHRLIDKEAVAEHSVERLHAMKKKHEDRIRLLTEIDEAKISIPLIYAANIGQNNPTISRKDLSNAMIPGNYPSDNVIELSLKNSEFYDNEELYWKMESAQIEKAVSKALEKMNSNELVDCISVFAMAPQPLLVKLGSMLGDIQRVKVYQKHREPDTWRWLDSTESNPIFVKNPKDKSKSPVLVFALSAEAIETRVLNQYGDDASIWVITAKNPNNDMLRTEDQLTEFRKITRKVLDDINSSSKEEAIKVYMAMPLACAVELGRVWMPKADKSLVLYDKNNRLYYEDVQTITLK